MSHPRRPADPYGRPAPHLVAPPSPDRLHTPGNTALRAYLLQILEEDYAALFQQGIYAEVYIHLRLVDGRLLPDLDVTVERHYRPEREEQR